MIDCKHVISTGQIAVYVQPGCPRATKVLGTLVSSKQRCGECRSRESRGGSHEKQ